MTTSTMTPLETALDLHKRGFWAVAIKCGVERPDGTRKSGKAPIGKAWGVERWLPDRLRDTFAKNSGAGVGIALGPCRLPGGGWLADFEGDGPEAAESFSRLMGGEIPETLGWGSTKGAHNLFEVDGDRLLELLASTGGIEIKGKPGVYNLPEFPGLEMRIGGLKPDGVVKQLQSVCPPTIGDNGLAREWNGHDQVQKLPETAYAVLGALADARRMGNEIANLGAQHGHAGGRNGTAPSSFTAKPADPERRYAAVALEREIAAFSAEPDGKRHHYLLGMTIRLASLVKAGLLSESEALAGVNTGGLANGMLPGGEKEINDAWVSGYAMATARVIPDRPRGVASNGLASAATRNGERPKYTRDQLGIITAADVIARPIDWLWQYRFAMGEMSLLAGDGGVGKSSVLLDIAARVSLGTAWPHGGGNAPVGDVLIVSAEDSREQVLQPRLRALGADLTRIHFVTAKLTILKPGEEPRVNPQSLSDHDYWRDVLAEFPECKLLIIDPLPSYLGRGVSDSKNSELRAVLEPFIDDVIRPAGVAFIANTHLGKTTNASTPVNKILGSVAYVNLARCVHVVVREPERPDHRLFGLAKSNISPMGLESLGFEMRPFDMGEGIEGAVPAWDAGPSALDVVDVMGGGSAGSRGPAPVKAMQIAEWLYDFLHGRGPVQLHEIIDAAGEKGFLGEHRADGKDGRLVWTGRSNLYEGKKKIHLLAPPREGFSVEESGSKPKLWELL